MEVAAGVHLVPGTVGNITLVCAPEVALFDSGLPGDGPAVLAYLSALGIAARDLGVIALTHADPGHAGGAPWLRRQTAARILAAPAAAAAAAGNPPAGGFRALGRTVLGLAGRRPEVFAVDGTIGPGDVVAGFEVVATPGHTPGHLSFFRPGDGVLVAGDAVRVAGLDILAPPFWDTRSEPLARASIAELADLPVHLLIPGHGPPYREPAEQLRRAGGPPGFMAERLARLEERRQRRAARRR